MLSRNICVAHTILASLLLTTAIGCDEPETHDDTLRSAFWVDTQCVLNQCWGLFPAGEPVDAWVEVYTRAQIDAWVDTGRFVPDTVTVGYGGCGWGTYPTIAPEVECWTINGTTTNRCFGGDDDYLMEIKPACQPNPSFSSGIGGFGVGSCANPPVADMPDFTSVIAHNTKPNLARGVINSDAIILQLGCSLP